MSEETKIPSKRVRVKHKYPESIETKVSNHFVIQHDQESFTLSFFEIRQPIILGETEEEKIEQLDAITEVEARCLVRLLLTPSNMYELTKALQENFQDFENKVSIFDEASESENNESE